MSNNDNQYSIKFITVLLCLLLVGFITTIIGLLLVSIIHEDPIGVEDALSALIFVEIVEVLFSVLCVKIIKVNLTRESIRGHSFLLFKRHPTWDQIESVKPFSHLFLKYLRVNTSDGKSPLWLPLFLKNQDGFNEKILEYVPDENPLRQFFNIEKQSN